jgi:hypothetical protein
MPGMNDHNPDEYLPVESAGNVAGIPARTLRSWVRAGKLPATEGQRGKLVRLGDVLAIAEATGRSPATGRQTAGNAGKPATSADHPAGNAADVAEDNLAVSPAARAQLEAIRDEWLAPLVARNEELARELGRVEAERDELRRRVADLEAERRQDAPVSRQDRPGATEASSPTDEPVTGLRAWWRFWER